MADMSTTGLLPNDRPGTGLVVTLGTLVILLFFGIFLGWAATAPLGTAAVATGVAQVEGERKAVQHFEGGIVREIRVAEGQPVEEGEILVVLSGVGSLSEVEALTARLISASAEAARRKAERDDTALAFPSWLTEQTTGEAAAAVAEETGLFHARRENHLEEQAILDHRIDQLIADIEGKKKQLAAERRQLKLLKERVQRLEPTVRSGVAPDQVLYELRQEEAQLEGRIAETIAAIQSARRKRKELAAQIRHATSERRLEASEALAELTDEITEIETRMRSAEDVLSRRNIRAPIDGVVMNLSTHTIGGVVAPGAVVLELVPFDADIIIDAKLRPQDRDAVQVGQRTQIKIDTAGFRDTPPLPGHVVWVSADRMSDEIGAEDYFLARIEFEREAAPAVPRSEIFPGMQASVIIETGERTVLSYLVEPLTKSFWRAMREE